MSQTTSLPYLRGEKQLFDEGTNSVWELLEKSNRYSRGRTLTIMEIELKLKDTKSRKAIYNEVGNLLKHKLIKRIKVSINDVSIPFYYKNSR